MNARALGRGSLLLLALLCMGGVVSQRSHAAHEEGQSQPDAAPATPAPRADSPMSTRPGRSGRDLGSRVQATPEPAGGVQPVPTPSPPPVPVVQPTATPLPMPSAPAVQTLPQSEMFRRQQEQRRREMERIQQEAEDAERKRREARMREIVQQQQEAIRKEEEQRRRLLEQLPVPPPPE